MLSHRLAVHLRSLPAWRWVLRRTGRRTFVRHGADFTDVIVASGDGTRFASFGRVIEAIGFVEEFDR